MPPNWSDHWTGSRKLPLPGSVFRNECYSRVPPVLLTVVQSLDQMRNPSQPVEWLDRFAHLLKLVRPLDRCVGSGH